jgi:hypothetical protein
LLVAVGVDVVVDGVCVVGVVGVVVKDVVVNVVGMIMVVVVLLALDTPLWMSSIGALSIFSAHYRTLMIAVRRAARVMLWHRPRMATPES